MTTLAEHARRELTLCGQYAEDPAYSESIIAAVEAFAAYGHSGGSAEMARAQLGVLLARKPLSPLTADPAEWEDKSEISGTPLWQNRRDSEVFSADGGQSWYSVNRRDALERELAAAVNRRSAENDSDTPDFILAGLLADALDAFGTASRRREDWYGHRHEPGSDDGPEG